MDLDAEEKAILNILTRVMEKQTAVVMSLCFSPMDLCAILVLFFKAVHYSVHFTHQPLPDARSAAPSFTFLAHKCTDIHVFFLWIDVPL